MGNGVDPAKGLVYVPFNLKVDVIDKMQQLTDRFDDHIKDHQVELQKVREKQERAARTAKWIIGALATIAPVALAALFGVKA